MNLNILNLSQGDKILPEPDFQKTQDVKVFRNHRMNKSVQMSHKTGLNLNEITSDNQSNPKIQTWKVMNLNKG